MATNCLARTPTPTTPRTTTTQPTPTTRTPLQRPLEEVVGAVRAVARAVARTVAVAIAGVDVAAVGGRIARLLRRTSGRLNLSTRRKIRPRRHYQMRKSQKRRPTPETSWSDNRRGGRTKGVRSTPARPTATPGLSPSSSTATLNSRSWTTLWQSFRLI